MTELGSETERRAFVRALAQRVCEVIPTELVVVVSSDPDVLDWAEQRWRVLAAPAGLNPAVNWAYEQVRADAHRVVVCHADLARIDALSEFLTPLAPAEVTIAPDRGCNGTNVIGVPASADFRFQFGAHSFSQHLRETHRLGLVPHIIQRPELALDVDTDDDRAALGTTAHSR